MVGYVRTDTTNKIANGEVVDASFLDAEFDGVQAAFHASTGHVHDGTTANGAPITKVGPVQDLVVSGTAVLPKTDNTLDLGSATFEFKDLWIDGTANIDSLVADTAAIPSFTGTTTFNGNSIFVGSGTFSSVATFNSVANFNSTFNTNSVVNINNNATFNAGVVFAGTPTQIGNTRGNLVVPTLPQIAAGAGQWLRQTAAATTTFTLPASGTWAYFYILTNASTNVFISMEASVAAGGTAVLVVPAGQTLNALSWRIN